MATMAMTACFESAILGRSPPQQHLLQLPCCPLPLSPRCSKASSATHTAPYPPPPRSDGASTLAPSLLLIPSTVAPLTRSGPKHDNRTKQLSVEQLTGKPHEACMYAVLHCTAREVFFPAVQPGRPSCCSSFVSCLALPLAWLGLCLMPCTGCRLHAPPRTWSRRGSPWHHQHT